MTAAPPLEPTFYYFAYGTDMSVLRMVTMLQEAATNLLISSPTVDVQDEVPALRILSTHPATIQGYRIVLNAVSREGPRLAIANLVPDAPSRPTAAMDSTASPETAIAPVTVDEDGRVYGVLHELSTSLLPIVLEAAGMQGSHNVWATLPCTLLHRVVLPTPNTGESGSSVSPGEVCQAIVVAAFDIPHLELTLELEGGALSRTWKSLPPLHHSKLPEGHVSHKRHRSNNSLKYHISTPSSRPPTPVPDLHRMERTVHGTGRWPECHWCNCIVSQFVAPTPAYLGDLRKAFFMHGLQRVLSPTSTKAWSSLYGICQTQEDGSVVDPDPYPTRDCLSDPEEQLTWYLAYSSHLSWEQVCLRIGPPYCRRPILLKNWVLVPNKISRTVQFNSFGYYNIEAVADRRVKAATGKLLRPDPMPPYVFGAGYEISMAQLHMIDTHERGSRREMLLCEDVRSSKREVRCWVYISDHTSEALLPSKQYLSRVLEGSDILPLEYIRGIEATETNPLQCPGNDELL